jgi:hypothetical protein
MRKVKRESYKPVLSALGYFNLYLFFYLPYWIHRNPTSELEFPGVPSKLLQTVFISRLLPIEGESPKTFIEVMDAIHATKRGSSSFRMEIRSVTLTWWWGPVELVGSRRPVGGRVVNPQGCPSGHPQVSASGAQSGSLRKRACPQIHRTFH